MKTILIILDGASDLPNKHLHNKTPFEAAHTPNLDFLARNGNLGIMYPLGKKKIPSSANSLITLLGNDPKKCERGIYETVGSGITLKKGDLALRTNFATIDDLKSKKLIDRRAGRTLTTHEAKELEKSLNEEIILPCKFEFKSTVQHRGVLVLKGNHSDKITPVNSGWAGGTKANLFRFAGPVDNNPLSKKSSILVNDFIIQAHHILKNHPINIERERKGLFPGNIILTRGAGNSLPKIKQYKNWMAVNSMPLEVGIAKLSGMKNFPYKIPSQSSIDTYAYLNKLMNLKIKHSIYTIKKHHKNYAGCYLQIKETDLPGHDNKPHEKVKMIETLDKKLFSFIKKMSIKNNWKIIITCDHSTPCELKGHSADPVPVLVYNNKEPDHADRFTELEARIGSLKAFSGKSFANKVGLDK
jgi:2,3-bisphosphoglycerate-independent phosphoglycerate mutase